MTVIIAVWCHRNIVIADRFTSATAAHTAGRARARRSGPSSSSAPPHWARPKVTAASVGGSRLERAPPGTPTMAAGYPANRTSPAVAAAPPASSTHPVRRSRSPPRAQAAPRLYGTSQPAATLIQPSHWGPSSPSRKRSTCSTTASGHSGCSRATSGVAAVSTVKTSRNHSGDHTSLPSARTVSGSTPETSITPAATAHTARTTRTGRNSRPTRARSHRPYDTPRARAEAYPLAPTAPPTRKKTASVWNTQETGVSSGRYRSGLAPCKVPLSATSAVTSQWPPPRRGHGRGRRASPSRRAGRMRAGVHARPSSAPATIRARLRRETDPGLR